MAKSVSQAKKKKKVASDFEFSTVNSMYTNKTSSEDKLWKNWPQKNFLTFLTLFQEISPPLNCIWDGN